MHKSNVTPATHDADKAGMLADSMRAITAACDSQKDTTRELGWHAARVVEASTAEVASLNAALCALQDAVSAVLDTGAVPAALAVFLDKALSAAKLAQVSK